MRKIDPVLHERLAKLIHSMGYELLGYEFISKGQMIFRIYIDSEKGITVDDCSQVSRQVSAMMDVEDAIQASYALEVSSPGIDRPLFELEHYRRQLGKQVKITLHLAVNNRKHYKGILKKIEGDNICLWLEDLEQEVILPFSTIEKGNLIGDAHF